MPKTIINENELGDRMMTGQSFTQGGGIGSTGYDTYSSPDVSQNPNSFKYTPSIAGSASDITLKTPDDYNGKSTYDKKDKVTPDEIMAGLQYILKRMVFKRKDVAKEIVVRCLKKDPKYFSKLHMLNIDGDNDDIVSPSFTAPQSVSQPYSLKATPQEEAVDYRTPQEKEIGKIIREMAQAKHEKRYPKS